MEIRAHYILVGACTLLLLLGGLGFTLWLASMDKDIALSNYEISFNESIRGLSVNSDVLFVGIRVGKVTGIKISQVNPGEARVRIAIAADTPVREDSVAQIEIRALTGGAVIAISGGTAQSPLKHVPSGAIGEIAYEPSPLSSVVAQMPDVLASANHTLRRIEKIFSLENEQHVSNILQSLDTLTASVAQHSGTITTILADSEKTVKNFNLLAVNANQALITDIKNTSNAIDQIVKRLESTITTMSPGLKRFSTQGLSDLNQLMVDMTKLVQTLTRLSQKVESDPRRFFFGSPVKEVTTNP